MKTIGLAAPQLSSGMKALFDALGEALGIRFVRGEPGDGPGVAAWIVLEADRDLASRFADCGLACYIVPTAAALTACGATPQLEFTAHPVLPAVLRHRTVSDDDVAAMCGLPAWFDELRPLAHKDGVPVWSVVDRAGIPHHIVAVAPPELNDDEPLFAHFCRHRLAALLPLVSFVLDASAEPGWDPPPLQASFMFDDPNLHWPSYGFVDFEAMAEHANAAGYHAAFATIPLDAWYAHPGTAALFMRHADRLSLLVHGNDHVANELARPRTSQHTERLLSQALTRIRRLEDRASVSVSRVMAPPHGACSEETIAGMATTGFEALCVSRGSLRFHNAGAPWLRTLGMRPADVVAGLTVIPRFGLAEDCSNDILIAALLRQPIVPMAHHQALANGYDLLDRSATSINGLGQVCWRNMTAISRSLYASRRTTGSLEIRMFAKRVIVQSPDEPARVSVHRPWLIDGNDEPLRWRTVGVGDQRWTACRDNGGEIRAGTGAIMEIASGPMSEEDKAPTYRLHLPRPAPLARRILTEGRDRALPSLRRALGSGLSRARTPAS